MSDDRRAEIEAVADILAWEYGLSERPSRRILEAAAKCIAALDRVRDARGENPNAAQARRPLWRCFNPKCEAWKQVVEPTKRGRCPECGRTVIATWPEDKRV